MFLFIKKFLSRKEYLKDVPAGKINLYLGMISDRNGWSRCSYERWINKVSITFWSIRFTE